MLRPILALLALLAAAPASLAQEYPTRPIRLVVPYPPGSGTDIVGRLVGQRMGEALGQTIIVDNRPGAGGTIGADAVAKAPADGYVLLMADVGPLAISPAFQARTPYDTARDFAPVGGVAVLPFLLVVNPEVPARSLQELVAHAKARPGALAYGSVGSGTAVHLATELFKRAAGVDLVHVPYRGSAPAVTDLIAGRVQTMFVNVASALPVVQSGQLRAIAVATARRSPVLPDLPTMAEAGMADFTAGVWFGILAPAGTPAEIVVRLNAELVRALAAPDIVEKLVQQGAEASPGMPQAFAAQIRDETARWAQLVKEAGVRAE